MGDLDTDTADCQVICSRLGVAVFNVAYRLYPDVDFPVPITDCYDAVKYLAANYSDLSSASCAIELSRGFIVAGSSGGGTFATIITHLARDDGLVPKISGCHVACPILSDGMKVRKFGPERYRSKDLHSKAMLMDGKMEEAIAGELPLLTAGSS